MRRLWMAGLAILTVLCVVAPSHSVGVAVGGTCVTAEALSSDFCETKVTNTPTFRYATVGLGEFLAYACSVDTGSCTTVGTFPPYHSGAAGTVTAPDGCPCFGAIWVLPASPGALVGVLSSLPGR